MNGYASVLFRVAVTSRLTFLALAFIANAIFPDHKSTDAFVAPDLNSIDNHSLIDKLICFLFGGLFRWDAQHFLQIARTGYDYHTSFAFFPLFPLIVRYLGIGLQFLLGLNSLSSLLLASVLFNSYLFVRSTLLLYELSVTVLKHELFSFHSAIFFCLSPATVFFLAPYSESLFAFCTFKGMLHYAKGKTFHSVVWFALSTFARSNGVVNAGFPLHFHWFCLFSIYDQFKNLKMNVIRQTLRRIALAVLSTATIAAPFLLFQTYSYYLLCVRPIVEHSKEMKAFSRSSGIPLVGSPVPDIDCNGSMTLPYFQLQTTYWDVGFLRYYKLKQLPNFALATPIVVLVLYFGLKFISANKIHLVDPKRLYDGFAKPMSTTLPPQCLVYVVHAVYLVVVCALCINVQVTTRMIASSSPVIYWIASSAFLNKDDALVAFRTSSFRSTDDVKTSGVVISTYFMTYAILGTVLFANNVPWT